MEANRLFEKICAVFGRVKGARISAGGCRGSAFAVVLALPCALVTRPESGRTLMGFKYWSACAASTIALAGRACSLSAGVLGGCVALALAGLLPPIPALAQSDAAARYLAGLPLPEDSAYQALADDHWRAHKQAFDTAWQALDRDSFQPMRQWQDEILAAEIDPRLPLFYPFGGPDMAHALMLYPRSPEYLLFGLEPPGSLALQPDTPPLERHRLLDALRWALRDIYQRGYFITGRMSSDLNPAKLDGVLPLLLVFIVRGGHEVLEIEQVDLTSDGQFKARSTEEAPRDAAAGVTDEQADTTTAECPPIPGVRVRFRANDGGPEKQVTYLKRDVSDQGLGDCTALEHVIETLGPTNTFVKSASYLMHYATFSRIRALTLAASDSLLQDDTGIPYRALDQAEWDILLFGRYTQPIRDFNGVFQPDLNQAYLTKAHPIDELPFSMGYHWWTSDQNHLLARRRPVRTESGSQDVSKEKPAADKPSNKAVTQAR